MDDYLYEWERVYGLAKALSLPDVQEERPLFDFALALYEIDETYATNLELRIDENLRLRATDSSISCLNLEDAIEEFRNHHKRHQSLNQKVIPPASFAATTHNGEQPEYAKECVCGMKHLFKNCYYINPKLRPANWKGMLRAYPE